MQINNLLEEYKDTSTSRARLISLTMSTALFSNTRTWSFPRLKVQRKQKKSFFTTFFGVSATYRHGINIPLKKQVPFPLFHGSSLADRDKITDCYWLIKTNEDVNVGCV